MHDKMYFEILAFNKDKSSTGENNMQKFGDDGNEFWWNNDDQDTMLIILSVLFATGCIFFLKYIKVPIGVWILVASFTVFCIILPIRLVFLRKKGIVMLYMNEQGLKVNGYFIAWNHVVKIEIKKVPSGRGSRPKDEIFIFHSEPGKKRKFTACLSPEESEVVEIKEYIEAFWNYYKTSSSETGEITV